MCKHKYTAVTRNGCRGLELLCSPIGIDSANEIRYGTEYIFKCRFSFTPVASLAYFGPHLESKYTICDDVNSASECEYISQRSLVINMNMYLFILLIHINVSYMKIQKLCDIGLK